MPNAAPKPCKHAGCRALTTSGAYCEPHKKQKQQQIESTRLSSTQRGYGYRWQKVSKGFLKSHRLCQCNECLPKIHTALSEYGLERSAINDLFISLARPELASEVVDHIIPHDGDMSLFWDRTNWQAMNKKCHDKKTAKQDGGFRGKVGGGSKVYSL